jgi:hypothetical protein
MVFLKRWFIKCTKLINTRILVDIILRGPIKWVLVAVSPGVAQQEREGDHSSPSSAEVKNGGAVLPLPHTSSWRGA